MSFLTTTHLSPAPLPKKITRTLAAQTEPLLQAARADAVKGSADPEPVCLKTAASICQVTISARVAADMAADVEALARFCASRTGDVTAAIFAPVDRYRLQAAQINYAFAWDLMSLREAFRRSCAELEAFRDANHWTPDETASKSGLRSVSQVGTILLIETMMMMAVLKDVAGTPAEAALAGFLSAALILVSGVGVGATLGRELRHRRWWRKICGGVGLVIHLGWSAAIAIVVAGLRHLALELGDLDEAGRIVLPTLLGGDGLGWVLTSDVLATSLIAISILAALFSFAKGVSLGGYPGEAKLLRNVAATKSRLERREKVAAADLDEARKTAQMAIAAVRRDLGKQRTVACRLAETSAGHNRQYLRACSLVRLGLGRLARLYQATHRRVTGVHGRAISVAVPAFEPVEWQAIEKLCDQAAAAERDANTRFEHALVLEEKALSTLEHHACDARRTFEHVLNASAKHDAVSERPLIPDYTSSA